MNNHQETLLLTRKDVRHLLNPAACIQAVENAFRKHAEGKAPTPGIHGIHARDGGFHYKAGLSDEEGNFFVAKINANFPQNPDRFGLPTIQGVCIIFAADKGRPLCVMDSIELTILRTGAATAVAAKYLAKEDAKTATIWGCGNQGLISVRMLMQVRDIASIYLFDTNRAAAEAAANALEGVPVKVQIVENPLSAVRKSDICITCTTSRTPLLKLGDVAPGTFVAAVGADSESKQELDPLLMKSSKVVADLVEQSAAIGDLHHAIAAGVMEKADVHAQLGEVICGMKHGREKSEEIIIFDSTGMALQDVAAATVVYHNAISEGMGLKLNFSTLTNI